MRGTVAKRLRDRARKTAQPTKYKYNLIKRLFGEGKEVDVIGNVVCTGYRKDYKQLKKEYKAQARG